MVENFNRQVLRVAVAQICQSMGWDALQKSTHDTLTDALQRYLEEIGKVAYGYTQLCNRTNPNLDDLYLAFQDTGVVLQELENFVAQVDPLQFIHPFTTYPKCQPCRLQHQSKGELIDRAEFYFEHLPPLPIPCHEPTVEKEENSSIATTQETEKVTPLKESNNVLETSANVVKRRHEGGVLFLRDNKRSRLDIPANLILDRKENLENTDGESLSPATPVSPYLPQDLPKISEEKSIKLPNSLKVKTEQKQVPPFKKELLSPLQKITNPEKNISTETFPSPKKRKFKKEKSVSPNVQSIVASPISKTELLSPAKKPSSAKISPGKMKSPVKLKSSQIEKQVIKKSNQGSEGKISSNGGKNSKEFSPKASSIKKSPCTPQTKAFMGSPKVKELKPMKKKKMAKESAENGKSSHDAEKKPSSSSLNTPKLMIKLLPKSDRSSSLPKSSTMEKKVLTTPVKVKTANSPASSKSLSTKVKALESETVVKSEKFKHSSASLDIGVLKKEHSKKKKKKKDKGKEKSVRKEKHKAGKTEPPIPKIRFKLDPTGESKTGETSTSSKSSSSSTQPKKSSKIVIETENVTSGVITETLSNTLDYDPDRAYFCPVCHKQDDGSPMVGCDGCDEWCHWECVGLMAAPPETEKWYCPVCLLRKGKMKKGKGKRKS